MIFLVKGLLRWLLLVPLKGASPIIPVSIIYLLGRLGGKLYYIVSKEIRGKIENGFRGLIGADSNSYNVKQVVKRCCENYICSELEVFLYKRMKSENIKKFVEVEGVENIDSALGNGKGVILLHAHFGNAHMLMPGLGHRGYKINQVGLLPSDVIGYLEGVINKKPDSLMAAWFRLKEDYEKALPVRFIYLKRSMRPAIECLRRNEILAISIDGGTGDAMAVPFLNKEAFFLTGPIRLAIMIPFLGSVAKE